MGQDPYVHINNFLVLYGTRELKFCTDKLGNYAILFLRFCEMKIKGITNRLKKYYCSFNVQRST